MVFAVGMLLVFLHFGGLRRQLEQRVNALQATQAVQLLLVPSTSPSELSAAVERLDRAIDALETPGDDVLRASAPTGELVTEARDPEHRAVVVDSLVRALRTEASAISDRLGAMWGWLAAGAVCAVVLAWLAWFLAHRLVVANARAGELLGALRSEMAERRRAEEERLRRERLLDRVVEHAPVGIAIYGVDGAPVRRNPEHARLFAVPGPLDVHALEQAQAASGPATVERRVQSASGDISVVEEAAFPVPGPDGEPEAVVVFARDVTAARRRQQEAWAEDRAQTVATIARGMGHEIRNPLTFILGNVDWLLDEVREHAAALPEETRVAWEQALVDVSSGARRLRGAATDLGALGGRSGAGSCDAHEAARLALRLVVTEVGDVARFEVEPSPAVLVRGGTSHVALLVADLLRRVAVEIRAVSDSPWTARVVVRPHDEGADILIEAAARPGDATVSAEAVALAFDEGPGGTASPLRSLLAPLGASVEAAATAEGLRVTLALGAPSS